MLVGRGLHRRLGGGRRRERHFAALAAVLVAGEIEHLVLQQRTADHAAQLLLVVGHVHPGQRRTRVEVAGADHREQRAGHRVGAALGDHAGDAGRVAAELHRERVGDDLHFLHGLEREAAGALLRRALQREPLGVVVGAVHIGAEVPHLAAAHVHGVGARPALHHVGVEREQAHVVALGHRQRLERAAVDGRGDFRRRDLHERRLAGDRDGLLDGRQRHRHVDHGALAGVEREIVAHLGGEAGKFDGDLVAAFGRQRRERVAPVGVGHHRAVETGGDIADGDGGAGQHGLLLVGDYASNAERGSLGVGQRASAQSGQGESQDKSPMGQTSHREPPGRTRGNPRTWRNPSMPVAPCLARLGPITLHWALVPPLSARAVRAVEAAGRTAARNLCDVSLRTASGPEGSSAQQLLGCVQDLRAAVGPVPGNE